MNWCNIVFSTETSNPMYWANHFYLRNINSGWEEVKNIEIPDTITELGKYQFNGFSNIISIIIPSSIINIDLNAFSASGKLSNVYYVRSVTEWNKINNSSSRVSKFSVTVYYFSET